MVNRYLKAFLLTLLILGVGLAGISFIDDSRLKGITAAVEEDALELQASQQLFLYQNVFKDDSLCAVLNKRIDNQRTRAISILNEIDTAQANSLFGDTALLKRKFLLQNVELYLLMKQSISECGNSEVEPILYFYPDEFYCGDCATQAKVLDSVVSKCSNARVFAFPTDVDVPVIELLEAHYNVTKIPTLVIRDAKLEGLSPESKILASFACVQ